MLLATKSINTKRRAFTLVELLVVIAIIGLLSTVTVIALASSRTKARETKRIADIRQLTFAMQMYHDDYGEYPKPASLGCGAVVWFCLGHGTGGTCWGNAFSGCDQLDSALAPYMAKIPDDPDAANFGKNGDAYLYNAVSYSNPVLHWGMEKGPTTTSTCLGGTPGTWTSGYYRNSQYYCILPLRE